MYYNTTSRKVSMRTSINYHFFGSTFIGSAWTFVFNSSTPQWSMNSLSLVVSTRNNTIKPRENNNTITNKHQHHTNTCLELATNRLLNNVVMNPGFNYFLLVWHVQRLDSLRNEVFLHENKTVVNKTLITK